MGRGLALPAFWAVEGKSLVSEQARKTLILLACLSCLAGWLVSWLIFLNKNKKSCPAALKNPKTNRFKTAHLMQDKTQLQNCYIIIIAALSNLALKALF